MKLNEKALRETGDNLLFLITEEWQGLPPSTSYQDQAAAVSRALDSVEYIERAVGRGTVMLAHKDTTASATMQLVSAESLEKLSEYIKGNEAHARLPLSGRSVLPLADWDQGVKVFRRMVARAEVRAQYEARGDIQPNQERLDQEADVIVKRHDDAIASRVPAGLLQGSGSVSA